jgi:hypothetical protein
VLLSPGCVECSSSITCVRQPRHIGSVYSKNVILQGGDIKEVNQCVDFRVLVASMFEIFLLPYSGYLCPVCFL